MKALLFGMFLLAGTTAAFASMNVNAKEVKKFDKARLIEIATLKKERENVVPNSCTVTISWMSSSGIKSSATITATCECTPTDACNSAYAIARLALPPIK